MKYFSFSPGAWRTERRHVYPHNEFLFSKWMFGLTVILSFTFVLLVYLNQGYQPWEG